MHTLKPSWACCTDCQQRAAQALGDQQPGGGVPWVLVGFAVVLFFLPTIAGPKEK
jgi:hypothetical protein